MIASRKKTNLEEAASEMKAWLKHHGHKESQLQIAQCNIRKESEVRDRSIQYKTKK